MAGKNGRRGTTRSLRKTDAFARREGSDFAKGSAKKLLTAEVAKKGCKKR
jgi:hypothetical protein